jgi:hypothetical protein
MGHTCLHQCRTGWWLALCFAAGWFSPVHQIAPSCAWTQARAATGCPVPMDGVLRYLEMDEYPKAYPVYPPVCLIQVFQLQQTIHAARRISKAHRIAEALRLVSVLSGEKCTLTTACSLVTTHGGVEDTGEPTWAISHGEAGMDFFSCRGVTIMLYTRAEMNVYICPFLLATADELTDRLTI